MDDHSLPSDVKECHRLLLAAFKQSVQLEREAATAQQRAKQAEQLAAQAEQEAAQSEREVADAQQEVAELKRVLDETAASFEELQQEHAASLEELAWYKRWVHGRRSERVIAGEGQTYLFDLSQDNEGKSTDEESVPQTQVSSHSRRTGKRELDLSKLPHFRHESELSPQERMCSGCGRERDRIGEYETTVLEYVPSKLEVHVHVRGKYACRYCKDSVLSEPPPERPIARGIAGPGLIAQIIVSKFGDHLPLYRQEDIFVRHGIHLARSTLSDWVAAAAELLQPFYELQRKLVVQGPVMWTDDTEVKVQVGGKEGCRRGRFWTYVGNDEQPYSVYDFSISHSRDGPQRFLQDYRGYLHADAYTGYDGIFLGSANQILEVACWTHARRKFFEARRNYPRQANQVLEWMRQLYDLEEQAENLSAAERYELRRNYAEPALDKLEVYLAELARKALPKTALAKAVTYARNQWEALRRYTADGRLTIDNNTAERTLRPQAVGRKNWRAPDVLSRTLGRWLGSGCLVGNVQKNLGRLIGHCI